MNRPTRTRTRIGRRVALAAAGGIALLGVVAPGAQAAWACAGVGDPVDLGICVDDPLPRELPKAPRL